MEFKTIGAIFLAFALAIVLTEASSPALGAGVTATVDSPLTPTDTVAYLRTKRQFGYPGGYGGGSNSFANAQSSSFGAGGGFPGGFGVGGSSASAGAGSNSFGFGRKK